MALPPRPSTTSAAGMTADMRTNPANHKDACPPLAIPTSLLSSSTTPPVSSSSTSSTASTSSSHRTALDPSPSVCPSHAANAPQLAPSRSSTLTRSPTFPRSNTDGVDLADMIGKKRDHLHSSSSSSSSSSLAQSRRARLASLFSYLLGTDCYQHIDTALEDAWSVATKRRGVYNLIQVPLRLERLLVFGQAICLHEFLTLFTLLPIRLLLAVIHLLLSALAAPFQLLRLRRIRPDAPDADHLTRTCIGYAIDLMQASLLVFTVLALRMFDMSRIYHNIRGQSVIKLYVVFNVMEIFDRLCSSFGVDVLDSLGWTTASATTFFSRRAPPDAGNTRARALQGIILIARVAVDYFFTLVYVIVHAILLLVWVVALNVAVNTQNNALLTLLVSNNFVELKGSAFKSFKVPNVFQIACSDAVERFQLTVFLVIMIIFTGGDKRLFSTWAVIYCCEIAVDCIKHAFIAKFNRISHTVYHQFGFVIADDIVRTRRQTAVRNIGGSAISKRIGFVTLPLAALFVRMSLSNMLQMPWPALGMVWAALVFIKCALGIALVGHAWRRIGRGATDVTLDEDKEKGEIWVQRLMQVERYDLISKT